MVRVGLPVLVFVLSAFAAGPTRADSGPNIVLFLVDDMGWTDWQRDAKLNPTGSVVYETPHLLRLALSGKVFNNAYAACPVCSPTRAAIMTGKNPARLRLTDWIPGPNEGTAKLAKPKWTKNLAASEVTLAEALRRCLLNASNQKATDRDRMEYVFALFSGGPDHGGDHPSS